MGIVISHLLGGLGNQMFQYAFGRAVSLTRNSTFLLDVDELENRYGLHNGYELERVFNLYARQASNAELHYVLGWQAQVIARKLLAFRKARLFRCDNFVVEPVFGYSLDIENVPESCYLVGYWQSEKYFSGNISEIKKDFTFKNKLSGHNLELERHINECNSIGIHVRRGDYVSNSKTYSLHGLCSLDYYNSAIKYISDRIGSPTFFVFSDDLEWVKCNLKFESPVIYVDKNYKIDSHFDMQLMSICKHNIIANSSFSWWGAWLNPNPDKIVIAPKYWFSGKETPADLIPEEWILL